MQDHGISHVTLNVTDLGLSVKFYQQFFKLQIVHQTEQVAWLCDGAKYFVLVLNYSKALDVPITPSMHLGFAADSEAAVDAVARDAEKAGFLAAGPKQSNGSLGYWVFLHDPDGHTVELSYGQDMFNKIKGVLEQ